MGRYSNSGLGHGTSGSPQQTIKQGNYDRKVDEIARDKMVEPLVKMGVKFKKEDVVFVTKDKTNQTIWLEKGNKSVGLKHIIERHEQDYKNVYNVSKYEIPNHIKQVVDNGVLLKQNNVFRNGKQGYERIYEYNNKYYTILAIGTNGYIISMYPSRRK